ncbi:MAG TPA: TonB-dependent receptor [Parabacteroides sp.]|nr:TonB-dependent receptor [Parabacteroides sp.]
MNKYIAFLLLVMLGTSAAFAQQRGVDITGKVLEKQTGQGIEQAAVRLLSAKDSTMVGGVATDKNGTFVLRNISKGSYILNVTYVGFAPFYQNLAVSGKNNPVRMDNIILDDSGVELAAAVVTGKAAEVVVRNDTTEYNADSFKVAEGSMLEDLLKKMPGVEVDSDGKVTVNGKEIKKIMVDGKEFFSDDPKVASKNLPAKMIDKVQVTDKKSDMAKMTGFDDGEEETILNLTVKPGMKQGWFGNAFAGYGSKDRYEGNAMVNRFMNNDQITFMGGVNNTNNMGFSDMASSMFSGMRGGLRGANAGSGITTSGNGGLNFSKEFNKKITLGGNTRYSHTDNDAEKTSKEQTFLPGDSVSYSNNSVLSNNKSDNVGVNFRMDWKPDTLTQIFFIPNFGYSHSRSSQRQMEDTRVNADTLNRSNSESLSEGSGYNMNARLEFSRKLNGKGRVFSFSLSGGYNDSYNNEINYSSTEYVQEQRTDLIDQHIRYDNKSFNYRAYLSWVEPLGHNNFLQATYSFSQRNQESLKNAYNQDVSSGEYNVLDTAYSKNYRNYYINQRASLSFKAQRAKYNFTLGLNVDPSYSKSENFIGDTILSSLHRNVINVSPMLRFNYRFSKQSNLRVYYDGQTSQPSMTQMQPVVDNSDPLNIIVGNPDLKPKYTNRLRADFGRFIPEKQQAMMASVNGRYVVNDIVSKTVFDGMTGGRKTTYENVDGNYSFDGRMMMNMPLKNKKFSVNSNAMASFGNANSFINGEKNSSKTLAASERAGLDFRSTYIDVGVNGNFRYSSTRNSLQGQQDMNVFNYGAGGYTTLYLPYNFKIESDVNWSANSGYSEGFEQKEVLWNASVSKSFLRNNQGTLRFKIYDILQQRSNISRTVTASSIRDSEYNTLSSYFMFHFIYRFSIFKGGGSERDMRRGRPPFGGGGRMGPPPLPRF